MPSPRADTQDIHLSNGSPKKMTSPSSASNSKPSAQILPLKCEAASACCRSFFPPSRYPLYAGRFESSRTRDLYLTIRSSYGGETALSPCGGAPHSLQDIDPVIVELSYESHLSYASLDAAYASSRDYGADRRIAQRFVENYLEENVDWERHSDVVAEVRVRQ